MKISRRQFLKTSTLALTAASVPAAIATATGGQSSLSGQIGVTTGSFMDHITFEPAPGKQRLLDLPKIMRDELDMRVIDLMSRTLESFEPDYLEKLRTESEKNNCILTNLKLNEKGLDMASADDATRTQALKVYQRGIDAAQMLGCRWVRPVPGTGKSPDTGLLADSYRRLIDYGAPKGVSLLIENSGWVTRDPEAIPSMIRIVGEGLAASPDTGNWADDTAREEGLAKAFPLAVTSDFKAYMLEPDGSHPRYDLKRCFDIGWDAGFRGPWCIEHFNDTLPGLLAGFAAVRDLLRQWIAEKNF